LCLGESQSRGAGGHVLSPLVKFLQDQSLLALYSRLLAGLPGPAHAQFPLAALPVANKSDRRNDNNNAKSSSSSLSSLCNYYNTRFHPYMYDMLARRHMHASANHR